MKKVRQSFFRRHFVLSTLATAALMTTVVLMIFSFFIYFTDPVPSIVVSRMLAQTPVELRDQRLRDLEKAMTGARLPVKIRRFDDLHELAKALGHYEKSTEDSSMRDLDHPMLVENEADLRRILDLPQEEYGHRLVSSEGVIFPDFKILVRIADEDEFVLFEVKANASRIPDIIWILVALVGVAILFSTSMSAVLFYHYFSRFEKRAGEVIGRIKSGDLRARFKIDKNDEIGQSMQKFNEMADEVEILVKKIRNSEENRIKVLQQLAHDLRTPIASLKTLVETLDKRSAEMSREQRDEFFALSVQEILYFERLIEDLLFLARTSEPKYEQMEQGVVLEELVESESHSLAMTYGAPEVRFSLIVRGDPVPLRCDQHLLRRMIRNALSNAFSFANSKVELILDYQNEGQMVELSVVDDGPGFDQKTIDTFGERKVSRILSKNAGIRVSVGLGSVIIKAIAEMHGGKVIAENNSLHDPERVGACLRIHLPVRS